MFFKNMMDSFYVSAKIICSVIKLQNSNVKCGTAYSAVKYFAKKIWKIKWYR